MSDKAYFQAYYRRNRDKRLAQAKARQAGNRAAKSAYDRARRQEKSETIRAFDRERAALRRGEAQEFVRRAKARAKKAGCPFNITVDDIQIPETCPALGIPLFTSEGRGGGPNSPSLDRIVPELGYVPGNVVVISSKANRMKSDGTLPELLALCAWLATQKG